MKITLEQRAILVCMLSNFGAGMVFVLLGSPALFEQTPIAYYFIIPMAILLFVSVGYMNYLYLKHGVIEGFKKSGREQ